MPQQTFVTSNLDVAVTKFAAGAPVRYTGPHQGVFRFESVKITALKSGRERSRPEGESEHDAEALRRFFAFH